MSHDARLYRMTPLEVAANQIMGASTPRPSDTARPAPSSRVALEEAMLPALLRPPCLVSFSGGRDSSAVLAVATHLARRHGLRAPVPISYRFADAPGAEESEWQELVVRHLGLVDWERLAIGSEFDLVGPLAARVLDRYGLVFPPHAHWSVALFDAASGGSLLTGHGGDGLFARRRPTRLSAVDWNRAAPWRTAGRVVLEQMPVPARRALFLRRFHGPAHDFRLRWLRPAAREAVLRHWASRLADEPFRYPQYVHWCAGWRGQQISLATLDLLAAEAGVQLFHPLLDRHFVDSLASFGWRGPRDRDDSMQRLFSDVLPHTVLQRSGKAVFGVALFSEHSRDFVDHWTGDGVDPDLVDVDALQSIWSEADPAHGTHLLLQSAWLAAQSSQGSGPDGDGGLASSAVMRSGSAATPKMRPETLAAGLRQSAARSSVLWLDASGSSMMPVILPGQRIAIAPAPRPRWGEVWAYCDADGRVLAHRCRGRSRGGYVFQGDATLRLEPPAPPDRLIGRVVAIAESDRVRRLGWRDRWTRGLTRQLYLEARRGAGRAVRAGRWRPRP